MISGRKLDLGIDASRDRGSAYERLAGDLAPSPPRARPKWAVHASRALADGEHGFNELEDRLGVRSEALFERLRDLRCVGLVERSVTASAPPETSYRLTETGEEFVAVLLDLEALTGVVACDCNDKERSKPGDRARDSVSDCDCTAKSDNDCESMAVGDPAVCEC